jgi:hypothetical protein
MRERFRNTVFRPASVDKIEKMLAIVQEYQEQGLRLTARQLYYQFVSRDFIANNPREYRNLTSLLTDARYAGLVDWDAIEDRGRVPEIPAEWGSLRDRLTSAMRSYRLPRWANQRHYVELWVEKQALAGVLWPLAHQYHVPLMVNKGYSSSSAMYEAATRIKDNTASDGLYTAADLGREARTERRDAVVLYLGDHDPSGEDMVRDIEERLIEFGCQDLSVVKLALTMNQVQNYNPPPNPAKVTDSRAAKYIAKYGNNSWEVDALPPNVLSRIIKNAFDGLIDREKMDEVEQREQEDKKFLEEMLRYTPR